MKRHLTHTEIAEAQRIFSDGINYDDVLIYAGLPFFPPQNTAIAPNGCLYFPRKHFLSDFTQASISYRIWLIHELTHVWQYQNGFQPLIGGMILWARGGYWKKRCYHYPSPAHTAHFNRLNMEQQADFLADYYAYQYLNYSIKYQHHSSHIQRILQPFFNDPHDPSLLPRYWPARFNY